MSYSKKKHLRKAHGGLNDVGHNSWWQMKCDQHIAHDREFEKIMQPSLVVAIKKIERSAYMTEGGYHPRNTPPYPPINESVWERDITGYLRSNVNKIIRFRQQKMLRNTMHTNNYNEELISRPLCTMYVYGSIFKLWKSWKCRQHKNANFTQGRLSL